MEEELSKIVDKVEEALNMECGKVIDEIIKQFDTVCPEKEDSSVLTLRKRVALGHKVQESKKRLNGELKDHLAKCGVTLE